MILELICQMLMYFGLPVNKIIKHRTIFTRDEFLEAMNDAQINDVFVWDDLPYIAHPRKSELETWHLWGWYNFQKWGFNL